MKRASHPRAWSEQDIDRVEGWLREGFNPRQISQRLDDRTRNAVIGRINRVPRLKAAMAFRMAKLKGKEEEVPMIELPSPRLKPEVYDAKARRLTLLQLGSNECRYIAGMDHLFCGWPVEEGTFYCRHHLMRCINPVFHARHR